MSGGHGGRRRKHHDDHEEHPSEAWLIALADMMTLLMVTFLMMFAISSLDLKKFQTFKEAFAEGTGTVLPALPGEGVPTEGEVTDEPLAPDDAQADPVSDAWSAHTGGKVLDPEALNELQKKIQAQIKKAGLQDRVEAKIDGRGLVLYVTSGVLFDSGKADVTTQGKALIDGLALVLAEVGNALVVEGHTDSRPISSDRFASNWELSAMRATAVARHLMADGVSSKRVSIAGYADTKPRKDLPTDEAYATNRRVEIVVEAPKPKPVPPAAVPAAAAPEAAPTTAPTKAPTKATKADESEDSGH